jgi:hypothetical protein
MRFDVVRDRRGRYATGFEADAAQGLDPQLVAAAGAS